MRPLIVVVTGVAGSGKTTIGTALARRLGWPFADADTFHSPENIAKMHAGTPLTDADRGPWLAAIAAWIAERSAAGTGGVVTCSALKRRYRDVLRDGRDDVCFASLTAPRDVLAARMAHRRGHFMPASLLDSQLAALEPLQPGEPGSSIDASTTPDAAVTEIVALVEQG